MISMQMGHSSSFLAQSIISGSSWSLPVLYPSSGTVHSHRLGPLLSLRVSEISMWVLSDGRLELGLDWLKERGEVNSDWRDIGLWSE